MKLQGYGVVLMRGTPGGRHRASGSSLLRPALCFSYTALGPGSKGTSTPEPIRSTFSRIALGCQLPVRSGWPSAVRGVGPLGGQSASCFGAAAFPRLLLSCRSCGSRFWAGGVWATIAHAKTRVQKQNNGGFLLLLSG